ncbi:MAG: hypothetical protein AAB731_03180 [Patescibacteria group bacterium]
MKIKIGLLLKIYSISIIGLGAATVIFITIFLYKNLYQAITQTAIIYNLRMELAVEPVDIELFNIITKKIKEKTTRAETDWGGIRNPFSFGPPSPETKAEETKK